MKKVISLLFLTLVMGISQAAFAQTQKEVRLNHGQQKTAVMPEGRVKVKFISVVSDSRCPANANCVWAGNAVVKLQVTAGGETKTFELNTTTGRRGNQVGFYAINLESLTPQTHSNRKIRARDYRVTVSVVRITR